MRISVKDGRHCAGERPELVTACEPGHCKGSSHPSIDASGDRIAFTSDAEHVSCADPNEAGQRQIWVRDVGAGRTHLVSAEATTGRPGNGESDFARVAGDGACIVFGSTAALVPDDGGKWDVYACTLGADGARVVELVSQRVDGASGNGHSGRPDVSFDGRWVVYETRATDLTPGESLSTNGTVSQIVLTDRTAALGRRNRWISLADRELGAPALARRACHAPRVSDTTPPLVAYQTSGRLVRRDTNQTEDVYVRDVAAGVTRAVSVTPAGRTGNGPSRRPSVSANGRWVAFESSASDLTSDADTNAACDVFVHDLRTSRTVRVSVLVDSSGADVEARGGHSIGPEISADGRVVVFTTAATNLFGQTGEPTFQLCAHDRDADGDGIYDEDGPGERRTWCLIPAPGYPTDQWSGGTPIDLTPDAGFVAFMSEASTLVPDDRNGRPELNPGVCCRRRQWRLGEPGEECNDFLSRPPCEWGRDVFRLRLAPDRPPGARP